MFLLVLDTGQRRRDKAFLLKRKDRLTVLFPFISATCQLSVCDAGQRCLATSCLSYGSYSHHSLLHASMTSSALLHLLIICLCVAFSTSVCLSKTFFLSSGFFPLSVYVYFSPSIPFIPLPWPALSFSITYNLLLIVPVCLSVNSYNLFHPKRCLGWLTVMSLHPKLDHVLRLTSPAHFSL